MLPAFRRILDKLDGVRFLFFIEKTQKKAQFSFCEQRKLFIMKLFFEEFNIFFTAESAWPVLNCNQGSDILENFEVIFYFIAKEITF